MLDRTRFLIFGHRLRLKAWSLYRADFTISVVAAMLHDASTLLFLSVIFANIKQLQGWSFHEMVFIWGFAVISRNLANAIFDVPSMVSIYIRYGGMDRALVRPQSVLLQLAAEKGINLFALGRVIVGAAAIIYSIPYLHLQWWAAIYLPVSVVSGILLMFSLQLAIVCLCFWFVDAFPLLTAVVWMSQFGQYPIGIFSPPLQILFTWALPYAMMGFLPAAFLMRGGEYLVYGLLEPAMGIAFFALALLIWRTAIKHYRSTGS